jgi:hypothetical protein
MEPSGEVQLDRERPMPDFVILGVMKAGTTTLFRWIEQHPDVMAGGTKEPNYFSRDENFARGVDWYRAQLPKCTQGLCGEASAEYADPALASNVVRRLWQSSPDARLLLVVRHPVERLRSHYRHEVQRSRERRSLAEVVIEPDNRYVRRSLYSQTLADIDRVFDRDQLLVVLTERLEEWDTWAEVLNHLGLRLVPRPTQIHNVAEGKDGFSPLLLKLWEHGWADRARTAPRPLRKFARRLLMRNGDEYDALLAESQAAIPPAVVDTLAADAARFASDMNWTECPWEFNDSP